VGGDGRGPFDVATVSGPAEGGAEVGELGVRPVERAALVGTVPDVPLQQDLLGEVAAVPIPHVGEGAGAGELVLGELPDRLQDPVPRGAAHLLGRHEGLPHQAVQQVERRVLVVAPVDGSDGRQVAAVGEHGAAPQDAPLVIVEQVVGPLHRLAQGLVSRQAAAPTREQPETVVEPATNLLGGHRNHAGRRQLDREGDAVEPPADLRDGLDLARLLQPEAAVDGLGPLDEQGHGLRSHAARTSREGTGQMCSPPTRRASREVATTETVLVRARIVSTSSAAASRTCSQLSSTIRRFRPPAPGPRSRRR
jgi:hypothetical protein